MRANVTVIVLAAVPVLCHVVLKGQAPQKPALRPYAVRKLYPVDQAVRDPSFLAFRKRLQRLVRERNAALLLAILDRQVVSSFGRGPGVEQFRQEYHPELKPSRVWTTLRDVLSLGGSFRNDEGHREFVAPYVYSAFPEDLGDDEAGYVYGAIIGRNVPVHARPSLDSPNTETLSYDIVKWADAPEPEKPWTGIVTPKGRLGYVQTRYIRSPHDYRVSFRKVRGRWRMTSLVAGD